MAVVNIKYKPTGAVSNLSKPTRQSGGRVMKATWKVPKGLTDTNSDKRAEKLAVRFALYPDSDTSEERRIDWYHEYNTSTTESSLNIASFTSNNGANNGTAVTRSSFYPADGKPKLGGLGVVVRAKNGKGFSDNNAWQQTWFEKPRDPSIAAFTVNSSTWVVTTTITAGASDDMHERYDTRYTVTVYDSASKTTTVVTDSKFTESSKSNVGYDFGDLSTLGGNYVKLTVKAWSRGYAGDSQVVERSKVLSFPATTTITKAACPGRKTGSRATITLKTNATAAHPVDGVELEILSNTAAATAAEAASTTYKDDWTSTEIEDNGNCTAMSVLMDDYMPTRGNHTWLRVKSWHDVESVFFRRSTPVEVPNVHIPAGAAVSSNYPVYFYSAAPGSDGTSARIKLGWSNTGTTGVELSWSSDQEAWISTKEPSTYTTTRDDGTTGTYAHGCEIVVRDLTEGTAYYFKARRYKDTDGETEYYGYSAAETVTPTVAPTSVVLSAPLFVPTGSAIPFTWSFNSASKQREWQLVTSSGKIAAQGTDAMGAWTLPWERVSALVSSGVLTVSVWVSTGGEFVASESIDVRIAEPPTLSISSISDLTAQPLSLSFSSTSPSLLAVAVYAEGASGMRPKGMAEQPDGDTIWSNMVDPEWTLSNGVYTATVTAPTGLEFWDGCSYTVEASAADRETGLVSGTVSASFSVAFSHQAPTPASTIAVTTYAGADAGGTVSRRATIALAAPTGATGGDVYDVYRVTPDSVELVCQGALTSDTVTDEYAPFGCPGLAYRVACRTVDGDVEWADYSYTLNGAVLRVDFPGGGSSYIEMPYDPVAKPAWTKDFESRSHLDGKAQGYWNNAVARKESFSTTLSREDTAAMAAIRALATHVGPCFVRTPDGEAYQADVQVKGLDSDGGPLVPVSLEASEVALTEQFGAQVTTAQE